MIKLDLCYYYGACNKNSPHNLNDIERKTRTQKLPSINLLTNKHKRKTFRKISTSQSLLKRKLLFYLFETEMQLLIRNIHFYVRISESKSKKSWINKSWNRENYFVCFYVINIKLIFFCLGECNSHVS